jgi:hypothetical protein
MPIDTRPNSPTLVMQNHPDYYLPGGDLFIRVDTTLFRVHRLFFIRESDLWRNLLGSISQGQTANNPIDLIHQIPCDPTPTAETFASFLWVFYNPQYSIYETTEETWTVIFEQAYCWHFREIQNLCWREIEKLYNRRVEDYNDWANRPREFNPETVWTLLGDGDE